MSDVIKMLVPPAMQALVEVSKLNPKPGENGSIACPSCGAVFNYYRGPTGKLSGSCTMCGVKIPRA